MFQPTGERSNQPQSADAQNFINAAARWFPGAAWRRRAKRPLGAPEAGYAGDQLIEARRWFADRSPVPSPWCGSINLYHQGQRHFHGRLSRQGGGDKNIASNPRRTWFAGALVGA